MFNECRRSEVQGMNSSQRLRVFFPGEELVQELPKLSGNHLHAHSPVADDPFPTSHHLACHLR